MIAFKILSLPILYRIPDVTVGKEFNAPGECCLLGKIKSFRSLRSRIFSKKISRIYNRRFGEIKFSKLRYKISNGLFYLFHKSFPKLLSLILFIYGFSLINLRTHLFNSS